MVHRLVVAVFSAPPGLRVSFVSYVLHRMSGYDPLVLAPNRGRKHETREHHTNTHHAPG